MNAEAIRKTAVLREQDGDYIVQSPLCPDVIGAGDTEQEAWRIFEEILEDYLADHKAGRVATSVKRITAGRGRSRSNATRSKGTTKGKMKRISLPDDVATWLTESPAHIEQVRALMAE